jgi:hypothetical protein
MTQQVDFEKARQAARRVLELDKRATKGPWRVILYDWDLSDTDADWAGRIDSVRGKGVPYAGAGSFHSIRRLTDAEWFTETRTLAPMLARVVLELLEQRGLGDEETNDSA